MAERDKNRTNRGRDKRARGADEELNTIEPFESTKTRSRRTDDQPLVWRELEPPVRSENTRGEQPPFTNKVPFNSVPEQVLDRYYRIGDEYFFDNGELAFVNDGYRLKTRSENVAVIRDFLLIAKHNDRHTVTVKGTERFRREAWAQAYRVGLEVVGYTPSEHDKKQLVRALARENPRTARAPADEPARQAAPTSAASGAAPPQAADPARAAESAYSPPAASNQRVFVGELLDHGPERYLRDPKKDASYYVRVATAKGEVEQWGVDLGRAFETSQSHPEIGDQIVLRETARHPVTVSESVYDKVGNLLGEEEKKAHRNDWQIEKREFLDERARLARVVRDVSISPEEGTKRYPQLAGTYFVLKEAAEFAKQRYPDFRAEQDQFVSLMRERLSDEIERGLPFRTTRIRERDARTPEPGRAPGDLRQAERTLV